MRFLNKFAYTSCILACISISACTTSNKVERTLFALPEYTQGYSVPIDISKQRLNNLYQLMSTSGLDEFIQKRPTAKPSKAVMAHLRKLDKSLRIPYTQCVSNIAKGGPAYFSLVAEFDSNLNNNELNTLLEFYESEAGIKVANANRKAESPALTSAEDAYVRSIQATVDKKLRSLYSYNRWLINYDQQIIDACSHVTI